MGGMDSFAEHDEAQWAYMLDLMRANAVHDHDEHLVAEAVANISSGAGLGNSSMPTPIVELIHAALATGYASAINDVREHRIAGLGPAETW